MASYSTLGDYFSSNLSWSAAEEILSKSEENFSDDTGKDVSLEMLFSEEAYDENMRLYELTVNNQSLQIRVMLNTQHQAIGFDPIETSSGRHYTAFLKSISQAMQSPYS